MLSSIGLLVADLKNDYSRTFLQCPPRYDLAGIERVFRELEAEAREWLGHEDIASDDERIERMAGMRYVHQGFELTVPWPPGAVTPDALREATESFHRLHEQVYTFRQEDTPVEVVTLRVDASGRLPKPAIQRLGATTTSPATASGRRMVYFDGERRPCPLYDRARLEAGMQIVGPAIIEQLDSTTLVFPGQRAEVQEYGNLVIRGA